MSSDGGRLKYAVRHVREPTCDSTDYRIDLDVIESELGRLAEDFAPSVVDAKDCYAFEGGDVLFGKLRPYLAKSMLCDRPGCCSGEIVVLRPRLDKVLPSFLAYVVQSADFVSWAVATSHGVKMPRTSWDSLADFRLNFPELEEQALIVETLDENVAILDALLEKKRRVLRLVGERREIEWMRAVSGQLSGGEIDRKAAKVRWLETMPAHWEAVKLNRVARLGSGHTPSRKKPEYWEDCTLPWIALSDVTDIRDDRTDVLSDTRERISELGLANSSAVLHPGETVVLSRTASCGYAVMMGTEMAVSQHYATWTCSERLLPRFLLLCLRAMRRDLVGRLGYGSTHKTVFMPDIEALRIPLPPIEEQHAIVDAAGERIEGINRLSALIETQIPLLREHRLALITAGVRGELSERAEVVAA